MHARTHLIEAGEVYMADVRTTVHIINQRGRKCTPCMHHGNVFQPYDMIRSSVDTFAEMTCT